MLPSLFLNSIWIKRSSCQRLGKDGLQLVPQARRFGLGGGQIGQRRFRVTVVIGHGMRVLDVETEHALVAILFRRV